MIVARLSAVMLTTLAIVGCEGANPSDSFAQSGAQSGQAQTTTLTPRPVPAQSLDQSRRTAITNAVELVAPAVVSVQTETVERVPVDMFEMIFGGAFRTNDAARASDRDSSCAPTAWS